MINKKTKIVATIGPKTESVDVLKKLINNGLNVARVNMSHGDHENHHRVIGNIRRAEKEAGVEVAILQDLSGPKIRTGGYTADIITLTAGKKIILTTEKIVGNEKRIYVNYKKLPKEVSKGSIIMIDDGKKKIIVEKVHGNDIHCKVLVGGDLKARRGINIPGAYLSIPSITKKDKDDLVFGLKEGVDMVALSFVRKKDDILSLRNILKNLKKNIPIIAKIETQEAIDNLDEIIWHADGIMVARGDLAIEVPTEMVPIYQKQIIEKCNALGKPVITATQMLESMINNPTPTRAEVSDIANAIFDGTDAVMLSEESALGHFPVESVAMMSRIAETTETKNHSPEERHTVTDSLSSSITHIASEVGAKAIIALTESGTTARMIARFDPSIPVYALTPHNKTARELTLVYSVTPIEIKPIKDFDDALKFLPKFLRDKKIVKKGDKVVVAGGVPFGKVGGTNMTLVLTC